MKPTIEEVTKRQWSLLKKRWHSQNTVPLEKTTIGSHVKFWWLCPRNQNHKWQARITTIIKGLDRVSGGCPFCRGLKANHSNCLLTTHPELATQWHPENCLKPTDITAGCNKKAIWMCDHGHKWLATIASRKQGNGCPYCSKKLVDHSNCLSITHPELAKQWHPANNPNITPDEVVAGSGIKVWWKCPADDDHEWKTSVNKRTLGRGCPYCAGQKVVKSTCLSTLYPHISAEWHPVKNGTTLPSTISPGSHKKYWWQCNIFPTHEWLSTVKNRTKNGNGCPFCNNSKGELAISNVLKNMGTQFEQQKTFPTCKDIRTLVFDFHVSGCGLIEYQGIQHYKPTFGSNPDATYRGTKRRDEIKRKWCVKHGIRLLEIPYWKLAQIPEIIRSFVNTKIGPKSDDAANPHNLERDEP